MTPIEQIDTLAKENRRLRDLARCCRNTLYDNNLITDEEYWDLVARTPQNELIGLRIRTTVQDQNCLDDGEVTIPIGHIGTITEVVGTDEYAVSWDDFTDI